MNLRESSPPTTSLPAAANPSPVPANSSFADRIRVLIQRVGSATEIARKCGFSEGVVRSWRDGNSDPSRARCVKLARTLGISLVWLVAGEGAIQPESVRGPSEEAAVSEPREGAARPGQPVSATASSATNVDARALARRREAAQRLLEASLALSGRRLAPAEQPRWLAMLDEVVGADGSQIDADRLLAFQQQLAARLGGRHA